MKAKVIEVVKTPRLMLVVLQLSAGDVAIGMTVTDQKNRWRITGISTVPAEAWHSGRRGVAVQPLGELVAPTIGAALEEGEGEEGR